MLAPVKSYPMKFHHISGGECADNPGKLASRNANRTLFFLGSISVHLRVQDPVVLQYYILG